MSSIRSQSFTARLREIQTKHTSALCIGLDPDPERLPADLLKRYGLPDAVVAFNRSIIEATHDLACAFKLNLAFYEILGESAWKVLRETLAAIPEDLIAIADGKRGDIGNSSRFYADVVFDTLGFDACTVSPYMGRDSVQPFLDFPGRGVFILVRTSNPGASDFQELAVGSTPLYQHVAKTAMSWQVQQSGDLGFVVGATDTAPLRAIRSFAPDVPLLIPGVGSQGGNAAAVMKAAGAGPVLVNSSRQIIFASSGPDFATAARREAAEMRSRLRMNDAGE